MRFFVSIPFLFLAVFNTANAAPPTDNSGTRSLMAKRNATTQDVTPSTTNDSSSCARATLLASGIQLNIDDQNQEKNSIGIINDILNKAPVDLNAFAVAKNNLLTFVKLGIIMRKVNQLIATDDNPAVPGLKIVANAQLAELSLSLNLTGDPTNDLPIVKTLIDDFTGGIAQNKKNKDAATQTCGGSSSTPAGSSPTGTGT